MNPVPSRYFGVLSHKKDQSLTLWLRLLVKDPPLLSLKFWLEVLNPLHQLMRTLDNFVIIGMVRFLASIAFSIAPDPSL
jgi:hypothetical protein